MAGEGSKPKATVDDAYAYIRTVKSTFHNDPDKYDDFMAIMKNFKARKIDRNTCIEEVKELLKGHRDLISGFNAFLPKCLEIADWYNIEVLEAELQALLMAMQHTWSKGYRKIIFEGDNRTVESLLNGNTRNFELHNLIIEIQHWRKKFSNAIIKWSFRSTNKAADRLAKGELENNVTFVSHSTR
ncbi:putative transcription regulator Others family [Arabidopsis thaliana]|uniref:Paired amphipathic helix repeat-containing protein n=4 Tax=Arabidopsis TaxID=3701 RepID=F4HR59_ARATH|nr:paired amphipathic helix repeat-containing protein [Arabidopsis thaliana]AEE30796.1 paired amphipathic helix repeat-containing protein [Arabidopsis thaliana]KAG7647683.1 Paired amphipathic helix [Arabidopsis thaliana x Arabidopsis arenosa]KAG7655621.1 Paired amphipathic helix [Arabidopsis suecica]OAP15562.1 hypothetical protein AXX17_AT1G27670 [Arabidopsis thaliana]|eukprot:NP_174042.1 paired amphipathic helix repeat-containing protein [Arabidopsis thaliana]